MSCMGTKKRLLPAKRVWGNVTSIFKSKLSKLKRSKTLKHVTRRLNTIVGRPSQSPYRLRHSKSHARKLYHHHRGFAPVYVDELYGLSMPVQVKHVEPPPETKGVLKVVEKSVASDKFDTLVGAAAASSSSSSSSSTGSASCLVGEMEDIDLRAEMFIRNFREEMRLQRQRSFGEYQEMLARGV